MAPVTRRQLSSTSSEKNHHNHFFSSHIRPQMSFEVGHIPRYNRSHSENSNNALTVGELSAKLQQLQEQQSKQQLHRECSPAHVQDMTPAPVQHIHHHHHHPVQIDSELQKRTNDTVKDILDRLAQRQNEADPLMQDAPGIQGNGTGRRRHTHRLNPKLLKEARQSRSLRQSHGNANLRHS
ncbi:hypothetical protein BG011_005401 [Mortierella polycephala]|uniref:Uncharacterized protein n=1 Tax=Mortierella polycephala TaxID=41804 RepID=A0A9P6PY95_9FUNG|nr:hypothetical protein BG011_005401 [Mortierella polycephala]